MLKRKLLKRLCLIGATVIAIYIILLYPTQNKTDINVISNSDTGVIYLLNKDDYLSRLDMIYNSEKDTELIYEIIDILTIKSKISYRIRDGFRGIIPEGTKVLDLILDNNILIIDFSKEILNIDKNYEEKMLEAIVYSVTSNISDIKIKILVEGKKLEKLPHSNKYLPEYLDRNIRINKEYDISNMNNITYTTVYYVASIDDFTYYIPVTKVSNDKNEKIEIIIDELKSSSTYNTNMVNYISSETELIDYQIFDKSLLLNFNESILGDINTNKILEEVTYSINLSINDNYNVESVMYSVNDEIIDNYFLLLG